MYFPSNSRLTGKTLLIILLFVYCMLYTVSSGVADTASITGATGGQIRINNNSYVRMVDESINITIHKDFIEFDINYSFKNISDKPLQVEMGFPEQPGEFTQTLYNFFASSDNNPIKVKFVSVDANKLDTTKGLLNWYTYTVQFKPNQLRKISNRYWVYATEYRGLRSFSYIMRTGASWKGTIGKIQITAKLDEGLVYAGKRLARSGIVIEPDGFSMDSSGKTLAWTFTDLKPDAAHDVQIFYELEGLPFMAMTDQASSVLRSKGIPPILYDAEYAFDGDPSTAWGPNDTKKGIGEWIRIVFSDETPRVIKTLGVLPGRAPDFRFMQCSRIRKAHLLFPDGTKQYLVFQDIPIIQHHAIKPVKTSSIKLVIDEIAPGLWPEQCGSKTPFISEIKLLTE
ncbi:NADase-type glycan-binding domain-containing protein [Trichlorobacter sp.]|uniref:NADase-type glycan-binding domain-containing protein n=1 Tax=Trichlorobacter sp. TaxID=2911007 RepID=UPI002A3687EA|nr:DUF4424 family protein [Trichlorobacter sp.]MDY0385283.1 DUF4424 family protein [Trichlorobacter sp.]